MIDEFITYIVAERRYSVLTARNYRRDVEEYFRYLGIGESRFVATRHLTSKSVKGWIMSLSKAGGNSPATINRKVCSLRSFYKWLRRSDLATRDPFMGLHPLRGSRRLPAFVSASKMTDALARERIDCGDEYVVRRDFLIILFFYTTGIRLAELIGIRLSDFSSDMGELRITGKGNKERMIPIMEELKGEVLNFLELMKSRNICSDGEKFLFLTEQGAHVSRTEVYNAVKCWLRRAGVQGKASPHVLRHTFATHILNQGADMREIQELLGHNSLSATQIYTHNDISKLKDIYAVAHPRAGKIK